MATCNKCSKKCCLCAEAHTNTFQQSDAGFATASAANVTVTDSSFTFIVKNAGQYVIDWSVQAAGNTNAQPRLQARLDGTLQAAPVDGFTTTAFRGIRQNVKISLVAGSHTVDLQVLAALAAENVGVRWGVIEVRRVGA